MRNVPFPASAPRTFQWQFEYPGTVSWDKIGQVYANALQPAYQQLWLSSAQIIQEHLMRAWIDASQACFTALVENAVRIGQRAATDLAAANNQAATVFAKDVVDVTVDKVRQASETVIDNVKDITDAAIRNTTVH